jgi:L-fuculose-phosphate aldolase
VEGDVAARLVTVVNRMAGLGFAPAGVGNVSARLGSDRVAITPSGVPYEALEARHIVVVDLQGRRREGDLEPSSDTPVHLAAYRVRPDVGSVLHCHPPQATTLACLGWELPPVHYMLASIAGDGRVQVAPYAIYGSDELGRNAVAALEGDRLACLLANHGTLCLGMSPERALDNTTTLDWAAGVYLRARALVEEPPTLTGAEVSEVADKLASYGRTNRQHLGVD